MNRLGQTQQTMFGHDAEALAKRFEAFGCHAVVVDGSNVEQLLNAYNVARLGNYFFLVCHSMLQHSNAA